MSTDTGRVTLGRMAHTTRPTTPALAAFLAGQPLEPIGHRPDGRPIYPIAGGSETATETTTTETTTTTEAGGSGGGGEGTTTEQTGGETTTETTKTKVELTPEQQAHVDTVVKERLGKEKAKYEQQLKELRDSAGKTEVEKLTAERDRYKEQSENGSKTAGERLARTEAKLAARVAGARDDRLDDVVQMADLTGCVDEDGEVDEAKVKAAIDAVLGKYGEWKRTPGKSGGDLDGGGSGPKSFTEKQIADMSDEEYAKNQKDILEAVAAGRVSKG